MEPWWIPFLNGCFPLDSRGADSDRGAIAGNHCRHHSRHQGCTMYIAVPACFLYILKEGNLNWNIVFFITKEDGSILLGLKSLVFESYALLMDAQFIYWKLEKMHLDLKYGFAYRKYFILNYGFVYWKCRLAKGLLARIPTGFTVTLLLQFWMLNTCY